MKDRNRQLLKRILKITGIALAGYLFLLFILPILFSDVITEKLRTYAKNNLEAELNFDKSTLSFFKHFPSLTLTVDNFDLKGSKPFENEQLVKAGELVLGIEVFTLITSKNINISGMYLTDALINIQVDRWGRPNYNIYVSKEGESDKDTLAADDTRLKLKVISIRKSELTYKDRSANFNIDAKGLNYIGEGSYIDANVLLNSYLRAGKFTFVLDEEEYLTDKEFKAELLTKFNTNSLAFVFEQNDLIINKLPVEVKGVFNILKDGYEMDFKVRTEDSNIEDLFTALPAEYMTWMDSTEIRGKMNAFLNLKGTYSRPKNMRPDINFGMELRNGFVAYKDAPFPITNIFMDMTAELPGLDFKRLKTDIDSMYFNVDQDKFNGYIHSNGYGKSFQINGKIKSDLNLENLNKALGVKGLELKGHLLADLVATGTYDKIKRTFPVTKGSMQLTDGYVKTSYYPNPITDINFSARVENNKGTFEDASVIIDQGDFIFEEEPFSLNVSFKNFDDVLYSVRANGNINVSRIYQVFSRKDLNIEGLVKADIDFSGRQSDAASGDYGKLNNKGFLQLKNIKTTSAYFPEAFLIEDGIFFFKGDDMTFTNFIASYGQSDAVMNGKMSNVINYLISDHEILRGEFSLNSEYLNINEFISSSGVDDRLNTAITDSIMKNPTDSVQVTLDSSYDILEIPPRLDLSLNINADRLVYDSLQVSDLNGKLHINNGSLNLSDASLEIAGAHAGMEGFYQNEGRSKAEFGYTINASNFDVKRAYNEIRMFRELASWAENAEGIVSLDYSLKGVLNSRMEPVLPSIEGEGILGLKQVKLTGFKLFGEVSVKTNNNALNNPDLSDVEIRSTIKNNIINIERFKFKVKGFKLRCEGQTSLDGDINLKMRLGLPPFGIIGIPITATGTKDEPVIKMGAKTEDLEEKEFVESMLEEQDSLGGMKTVDSLPNIIVDTLKTKQPLHKDTVKVRVIKTVDSLPNRVVDTLKTKQQLQMDTVKVRVIKTDTTSVLKQPVKNDSLPSLEKKTISPVKPVKTIDTLGVRKSSD